MSKKNLISKWKRRPKLIKVRYEPKVNYRAVFNRAVKKYASDSLLDLGTGAGDVIFKNNLSKLYKRVVGIDIEPDMIKICKEKSNLEFYVMDSLKRMNFKDNSFNVITAMFAPYKLSEVSRLLKKGGHFIILGNLQGDHKEIIKLFPDIFKNVWEGKLTQIYFDASEQRKKKFAKYGLKIIKHDTLKYKWIFKNKETLKEFYQIITLLPVFKGKEDRLEKLKTYENGEIPITRIIGTTIAEKV